MQLSVAFALCSAVIGVATSSPASVPILSHLSDAPPSSYRPSGRLFRLPLRQPFDFGQPQQGQQKQKQEAQPNLYYGAPPEVPETTEALTTTTTTELPTTTEVVADRLRTNADAESFDQQGVYYIYHPDGLLQKVAYGARVEDMGYTARLTYRDVEPIKEPIYTYDPQTLVFSKIQL